MCFLVVSGKCKALFLCQYKTKIKGGNVFIFLFNTTLLSFQMESRYPLQFSICLFI